MRTLRLSLAGTVIFTLLGGLGGVVVAQTDHGVATYVTGVERWMGNDGDDVTSMLEMSDSRASGTLTTTILTNQRYRTQPETSSSADVVRGGLRLVNDEGSWSGHAWAAYHPEMGWVFDGWLTGDEAYEGLSLFLHAVRDVYSTWKLSFEGVIFEGTPPVVPAAGEVAAG
jgi:hypothetical protein